MGYALMTIILLAALAILCARLVRNGLQRRIGEDEELIASRNAALLIGEHLVLSDKHAVPPPQRADEDQTESARPASSGKRLLKIAS